MKKNHKVLIFGFKPFLGYKENITEQIMGKLGKRKNLKKIVFPVRFSKKIFLEAMKKHRPEIVLGLGQASRIKKINIERRAINIQKNLKKGRSKKIERNGPKFRFVNWKIKNDKNSRVSYDAGVYVCNFCIYVLSGFSRKKHVEFAFLHIPQNYVINKAIKFVKSKIDTISYVGV